MRMPHFTQILFYEFCFFFLFFSVSVPSIGVFVLERREKSEQISLRVFNYTSSTLKIYLYKLCDHEGSSIIDVARENWRKTIKSWTFATWNTFKNFNKSRKQFPFHSILWFIHIHARKRKLSCNCLNRFTCFLCEWSSSLE